MIINPLFHHYSPHQKRRRETRKIENHENRTMQITSRFNCVFAKRIFFSLASFLSFSIFSIRVKKSKREFECFTCSILTLILFSTIRFLKKKNLPTTTKIRIERNKYNINNKYVWEKKEKIDQVKKKRTNRTCLLTATPTAWGVTLKTRPVLPW